ncbi:MAG TPA: hypothetical protein VG294_04455 [Solirubrobacteraceae bacterium]|jgi:hypothetical protein|nr:hypothetical protein [Solirubrobacteraceae bacterium]
MPISTLQPFCRRSIASILAALALCLLALAALSSLTAPAHAATRHSASTHRHHRVTHARRHVRRHRHVRATAKAAGKTQPSQPTPSTQPVTFGIYPGGAAGTVGPSGPVAPEDPAKRLAALEQLKPANRPFVLHLYAAYTGGSGYSAAAQVGNDISSYTANGLKVELTLCYRPSDLNAAVDVPGFVSFVRDTVDQLGSNPGLVSLQVTNEANVGGSPNASDGYYPGVKDALIGGVIEASAERNLDRDTQLKVGFNWAYATDSSEKAFWTYLGQHGGPAFLKALDWVGLDAYPGTWGPPLASGLSFSAAVRQGTVQALSTMRQTYMPLAGIPASVPMHVSENGYPTGPGRTYAMQSTALQTMVHAVVDYSGTFNVSDYRWFDLRDADSSSTSFESQYGLMTDTYTPKPAFAIYQQLVASL